MVWNFSHSWRKLELLDDEGHFVITLLKLKPSKCMLGVKGGKFLEIELSFPYKFKGDPTIHVLDYSTDQQSHII